MLEKVNNCFSLTLNVKDFEKMTIEDSLVILILLYSSENVKLVSSYLLIAAREIVTPKKNLEIYWILSRDNFCGKHKHNESSLSRTDLAP